MLLQSRRTFFKTTFLTSMVMIFSQNKLFATVTPLQTLVVAQEDLFPKEMITSSNAFSYISIIFKHSRISADNKQFLRNGTKWINEKAVAQYDKLYTQLNPEQRQNILQMISKTSWGKSWIKTVLTYIMEAVLGDPIYGINKNEFGWKWLEHESGLPRPKEVTL